MHGILKKGQTISLGWGNSHDVWQQPKSLNYYYYLRRYYLLLLCTCTNLAFSLSLPARRRRLPTGSSWATDPQQHTCYGPYLPVSWVLIFALIAIGWLWGRCCWCLFWKQFLAFLLLHLWAYDRFNCLKWDSGRQPGAFKRVMTYVNIQSSLPWGSESPHGAFTSTHA